MYETFIRNSLFNSSHDFVCCFLHFYNFVNQKFSFYFVWKVRYTSNILLNFYRVGCIFYPYMQLRRYFNML